VDVAGFDVATARIILIDVIDDTNTRLDGDTGSTQAPQSAGSENMAVAPGPSWSVDPVAAPAGPSPAVPYAIFDAKLMTRSRFLVVTYSMSEFEGSTNNDAGLANLAPGREPSLSVVEYCSPATVVTDP
jgi:hypothetical protein